MENLYLIEYYLLFFLLFFRNTVSAMLLECSVVRCLNELQHWGYRSEEIHFRPLAFGLMLRKQVCTEEFSGTLLYVYFSVNVGNHSCA